MIALSQGPSRVRHCKIVGTLGPSSSTEKVQRQLIDAGLDIARLNFSHGTHDQHRKNIDQIRKLAKHAGKTVSILQDLQGPKIRTGQIDASGFIIKKGESYTLEYSAKQTNDQIIPIDYRELVHDVKVGQRVFIDDGLIRFTIEQIDGNRVAVRSANDGLVKSRKGVNFPDSRLSLPAMTEKDSRDLLFGVSQGVDYVALSFVQDPEDIFQLRRMISALGSDVPIIAKIEKMSAIQEIDAIAGAADGLMVARGDLGVEGSVERVPIFQRRIIEAAAKQARPVIIATQMLESMITNPRATLAEIADVANGVLDGADCVMLSGEVATGKYPVECVQQMAAIISEVEAWNLASRDRYTDLDDNGETTWQDHEAIARAACEAADAISARAIVCLTLTGSIARLISKWRPRTPIVAVSPRKDVIQRLSHVWGVSGLQNPLFYNTDILLQDVPQVLKDLGMVESGEFIVLTAGIPINQMSPTNMVKINRIP